MRRVMYLFNSHFRVTLYIWSDSLTNWTVTKTHMTVPILNWMIVHVLFHVCVLSTTLQTVMSRSCTTDTVTQSFVRDRSTLLDTYLWHISDRCKCYW